MIILSILEVNFGLFFWTLVIFLIFFFLLRAFAWKPILEAIRKREDKIEASLKEAEKARQEMAQTKAENEELLREARAEKERIINEANAMSEKIITEAHRSAAKEQAKEVEKARQQIEAEKSQAIHDIREMAVNMSIQVAEKILRDQLDDPSAQEKLAKKLISEMGQRESTTLTNAN